MNYNGLNALIGSVNNNDFHVLGVPSNVFGLQEPGRNSELMNGIREVRPGNGFVPGNNFFLTQKYDVNGDAEHELFTYMKGLCPATSETISSTSGIYWTPVKQTDISWNFEKFLIDREGKLVKRYSPDFYPQMIANDVNDLLAEGVEAKKPVNPKIHAGHFRTNRH